MTWTTAISDLRALLSDNSTDKLAFKKKIFGLQDGTNVMFKTFEARRLTDFTSASTSTGFGVLVDDSFQVIVSDDTESGIFSLSIAPAEGQRIEATYYHQWFNDNQIEAFLKSSANYIGYGPDYTTIDDGLQPCALKFAAADAYQELSVRFARMLSEQYRVEDLPKEALHETIKSYSDLSKMYRDSAKDLLKNFYTRQGRSDSPLFAFGAGRVVDVAPNR